MNNVHKVRIYDLSKELNLENKEILEICAQLNIAVKSHSSTITESQVERIKVMAEKYITKQGTSQINDINISSEKKQQILAIHHKQIHSSSTEDESDDQLNYLENPQTAISPQSPTAPKPPQKPISPTSIKSPKADRGSLSKPSILTEKSKPEIIDSDLSEAPRLEISSKENFEKPTNKPSRVKPSLEGKNKIKLPKRVSKSISLKSKEKSDTPDITTEIQLKKNLKKPSIGKPDLKKPSSHPAEEEKKNTVTFSTLDSSSIIDDDDDENDETDEILDIELKPKPQLK
jgi:translation initiation factor IF-2